MQSAAFFAFHRLTHNQIAHIHHITQFANLSGRYTAFEQAFSLFVDNIESVPSTFQTEVTADDAYVCTHNLIHFLHTLRNEHHFFRRAGSFVIPFGNIFIIRILINRLQTVLGGSVGIYHCFYQ